MIDGTRFEDFTQISADWFWETDADDRFSYFLVATTKAGLALDCRLGRCRRDGSAQQPDNLARIATLEAVVARRESFHDFIYRAGLDTDHPYWCSTSGEPRYDSAGTFLGYRGTGHDVTERIEAQRTFETQSQILQALLRAIPDGVQMFDKFNTTLAVNEQTYEILGIPNRAPNPDADSTFQSLLELAKRGEYGPGDPEKLARERLEGVRELVARERSVTYQRQLTTGRWIEARLRALEDGAYLSLYRDITESKEHEAELERQSATMSTIAANIDGGPRDLRQGRPARGLARWIRGLGRPRPGSGKTRYDAARDTGFPGQGRRIRSLRSGGRGRLAHSRLPRYAVGRQGTHEAERSYHRAAPQCDSRRRFGDDLHRCHRAPAGGAGTQGAQYDA
ncbi:MAG: PAS-domain containing protein [Reyranella sp.]|nr:PAS-domain containing protein [Reyranella sp.]MDP2378619.1 PAS-domain containing protein [Reyranella sp.]